MQRVGSRFVAPGWLHGGHAQTIAGVVLRSRSKVHGNAHGNVQRRRERIPTTDGDFLDLDWFESEDAAMRARAAERPLVLLLHGLEGSTNSGYVKVLARELAAAGLESVGLNFRSCSGELNRGPRLYHAGETDDVAFVIEQLAARRPGRPLAAVGFSIGGNMLLRWMGEAGERARDLLDAAAVVSVPFDLEAGAHFMEASASRLYLRALLATLRAKVAAKRELLRGRIDVQRALHAKTFFEFDAAATSPLYGFKDVHDYYRRASCAPWLGRVRVPTLVVHALDDPFLPASAIPAAAIAGNPWLLPAISEHGGHVGFIGGTPWAPHFFAEEAVTEHLASRVLTARSRKVCVSRFPARSPPRPDRQKGLAP
jgi:predicted alpha/beta-fold hydrolase